MLIAKVNWVDVSQAMHYHTPLITIVVFSSLLFIGIVAIGLYLWFQNSDAKEQVHDHDTLFEELCDGHQLNSEEAPTSQTARRAL